MGADRISDVNLRLDRSGDMTNEQWLIVYVAALILFPFAVQIAMIPILLLADWLDKITSREERDGQE